jgi:hypothetical protein
LRFAGEQLVNIFCLTLFAAGEELANWKFNTLHELGYFWRAGWAGEGSVPKWSNARAKLLAPDRKSRETPGHGTPFERWAIN